jgi:Tfp pilus assembly protein PilO
MLPRKLRFDLRQMARQILAIYLAVLAVNVLAYAVLVRPRVQSLRQMRAESQPARERLKEREREVKGREDDLAALDRAKADLERLRRDVLSTRDRRMIEVQFELAQLARQFGINLQRVQYENTKLEEEGLERFAMVVPLSGGYSNLRKFLQAVETSDKFLVIEQVALATGHDGGVLIDLNITLATYFDDPGARAVQTAKRRAVRRA